MRRMSLVAAVLAFSLTALCQQEAVSKPSSAPQSKEELLAYMADTRQEFMDSIKGLTPEQWNFKPAPDKWSVGEVAEHLTLTEEFLAGMVREKVMKAPADPEKKAEAQGKEETILTTIPDRTNKVKAPDPLQPTGRWKTHDEVVQEFNARREKNLEFLKNTPEAELRAHVAGGGPMGPMDAHQWMLFLAAHMKRHNKQIAEVKADPNFPKSE